MLIWYKFKTRDFPKIRQDFERTKSIKIIKICATMRNTLQNCLKNSNKYFESRADQIRRHTFLSWWDSKNGVKNQGFDLTWLLLWLDLALFSRFWVELKILTRIKKYFWLDSITDLTQIEKPFESNPWLRSISFKIFSANSHSYKQDFVDIVWSVLVFGKKISVENFGLSIC